MFKRIAVALLLLCAPGIADLSAGTGAGEVSLDRAAVQALLEAALAEPVDVNVQGIGAVSVQFGKPGALAFVNGGIEAQLPCMLRQVGLTLDLQVRFVPVLDRKLGKFYISAEDVVPAVPVPLRINFAALVPDVPLPQRLRGATKLPTGATVDVELFAQNVSVGRGRLVVEFGLKVGGGE